MVAGAGVAVLGQEAASGMRPCTSEQGGRKGLGPGTMLVTPASLQVFTGGRNKLLPCSNHHYVGFFSFFLLLANTSPNATQKS